jgi:hypothetical protein
MKQEVLWWFIREYGRMLSWNYSSQHSRGMLGRFPPMKAANFPDIPVSFSQRRAVG